MFLSTSAGKRDTSHWNFPPFEEICANNVVLGDIVAEISVNNRFGSEPARHPLRPFQKFKVSPKEDGSFMILIGPDAVITTTIDSLEKFTSSS